ncbi:50S ribosomal protein L21 [Buchnera aphidicola (Mindarus keteleerifoliae)]|uniref:50S ribosomal protein L21 n=1 Tax=Buchnera aphidicola TaxID=9 RepID=UPI0031B69CF8
MHAVFKTGGKQYKVNVGQIIRIEKLNISAGNNIIFKNILLITDTSTIKIGSPNILGSTIEANILRHGKSKKINIIKFNRRKHYKKKQGHRQFFTDIKILNIHYPERDIKNGT